MTNDTSEKSVPNMSRDELHELDLHANVRYQIYNVGREKEPLIVVDELLGSPEALIAWAINESQVAPAVGLYPGLRSPAPASYGIFLRDHLSSLICEVFSVDKANIAIVDSAFSMVATPIERLRPSQQIPHFDKPIKSEIAVLHYLCESHHGGTSFYRHKSTGFEFVDQSRERQYVSCLQQEIQRGGLPSPPGYICGTTSIFEQIWSVSCRFNRALIYRCSSLHSGDIPSDYAFDLNPWTGRFTIAGFLHGPRSDF